MSFCRLIVWSKWKLLPVGKNIVVETDGVFLKMTCRNPKCSEEIVCLCRSSSAGLHQNRVCLCVWFGLIRMPISSLSLWRAIVLVLVVWLRRSGRQAVRVGESERHAGQKQTETLQDRQSVSSSSDTVPLKTPYNDVAVLVWGNAWPSSFTVLVLYNLGFIFAHFAVVSMKLFSLCLMQLTKGSCVFFLFSGL